MSAQPLLQVPFLPQTEALCGGAAAAMVYRFWGEAHASVQQFAPLVDRRAGGIRDTDLVAAIRTAGWHTDQIAGSFDRLKITLDAGQPPILLIEDRPSRYHFVVAVGLTDREVVVHDPTWGPARRVNRERFERAWTAARSWMLVVRPGEARTVVPPAAVETAVRPASACDRLLDGALDEIEKNGLTAADTALGAVRQQCPEAAGPLRELGGVRLAQSRYAEAAALSREALTRDPADRYARDVLGSSLFLTDHVTAALREWNRIEKPQLDRVDIVGVTRTRYSLVAAAIGLEPNTLLTASAFALAARRVEQLPDRVGSALTLRPGTDGYAVVRAAIQEPTRIPRGAIEWGAAGIQTVVDREITSTLAGWSGQGEVWSASWRWWEHRPKIAGSFSAPLVGRMRGVWRVDGAWEAQTYRVDGDDVREDRRSALLSLRNWITPAIRYEARAGIDVWDRTRKSVVAGATLEGRLFDDRLAITGSIDRWSGLQNTPGFAAGSGLATFRSRREPRGLVLAALARGDVASGDAPLALWSGAGDGRARPGLLRAHRMLDEGIIDAPVFGRRSASTNIELQRWFPTQLAAVGLAGFLDGGVASRRLPGAMREPYLVDAGAGLRARVPGRPGTLRLDYAHGLTDGGQRVTASWDLR